MEITTDTKIIGRFHNKVNGTGLNIYNPYFEEVDLNAVYLLFVNDSPIPLVEGIRNLNLVGAITAGFEHDETLPKLVDELSEASKLSNRVAMIANRNGKLYGHYQGGEGLLNAITEKYSLHGKKLVIVGAGTVAKTLILGIRNHNIKTHQIHIVNRTLTNAKKIKDTFDFIDSVGTLETLNSTEGDILINASRIGSKAEDAWFTKNVVNKFEAVADVTFGVESTNLTDLAHQNNEIVISGWDMFTHQAAVILKEVLGHSANINILREKVRAGLSNVNHGSVA